MRSLRAIPPIYAPVRVDAQGDGHFMAMRGNRFHKGVDLLVSPGESIRSPIDGVVKRLGTCYPTPPHFGLVEIMNQDTIHRILYIDPRVHEDDEVRMGDEIGVAQDVTARYDERMKAHIHWEIRLLRPLLGRGERVADSVWIDPQTVWF